MAGLEQLPNHDFSSREIFHRRLTQTVESLSELEINWKRHNLGINEKLLSFSILKNQFSVDNQEPDFQLGKSEELLFHKIFDLFSFKNKLTETDRIAAQTQEYERKGRVIGFFGPLGVGKSRTAKTIAQDFDVDLATVEPYVNNPFWVAQQNEPDRYDEYMLRSQVYFLVSNLNSDIRADVISRIEPKTFISDTNIFTDILMWVEWYYKTGRFSNEEFQTYKKLVNLLLPIIPKPDLLVVMNADSAANLKTGVENRRANESARKGEIFTEDELGLQMAVTEKLTGELDKLGVPILNMTVNPLEIWENPHIGYDVIFQIRKKLGLLGEFLNPKPEDVADQVMQILSPAGESKVIIIHSQSMFSGKTTAECMLAERVGLDKVIAFQPKASIRSNEKEFKGQEFAVMSRDGLQIKAMTIETNNLHSIVDYIKKHRINPKNKPYIFIDEIMLFLDHDGFPGDAINTIEELRMMGFHVIADGIDYSFKEEPFTFMFNLLKKTLRDDNWYQVETSTRCRYCNEPARGTSLTLVDADGRRRIAPYNFKWNHPGSMNYDPVCCKDHKSCTEQKPDFVRRELPTHLSSAS